MKFYNLDESSKIIIFLSILCCRVFYLITVCVFFYKNILNSLYPNLHKGNKYFKSKLITLYFFFKEGLPYLSKY